MLSPGAGAWLKDKINMIHQVWFALNSERAASHINKEQSPLSNTTGALKMCLFDPYTESSWVLFLQAEEYKLRSTKKRQRIKIIVPKLKPICVILGTRWHFPATLTLACPWQTDSSSFLWQTQTIIHQTQTLLKQLADDHPAMLLKTHCIFYIKLDFTDLIHLKWDRIVSMLYKHTSK